MGLGHFGGGTAVARWLVEQGARVQVTDRAPAQKLADALGELAGLPIDLRLGEHREEDFRAAELVVASPAVPPANPFLQVARAAGVPVTTEIRLFIERCPCPIAAVTGTKGKSTTTAMLGRILARRRRTWVGGNIGRSLLFDLPQMRPDHVAVLEVSSFMLEYLAECRFAPHVALLTFLAPDHLDRHGTLANYLAAKQNLVRFQTPRDFALLDEDSPYSRDFAAVTTARVAYYGLADRPPLPLALPGEHNQRNAQGALAAAACFGCTREDAELALVDFRTLPHRLELVHAADGVEWYNDSIATIPQAAEAALRAFPVGRVIQIVGGSSKGLDTTTLAAALAKQARAVLAIGATGPALAAQVRDVPGCSAELHECGTLAAAVALARQLARPGDVVLLSPGFASYDQFAHFEARGEEFARLARANNVVAAG
jgi:UDP-N-acetylmuramoylalanine--D-glutamate ligase